jgi:L-alanine-DL-glutamate epimerase-like enolase superfamily enzyme
VLGHVFEMGLAAAAEAQFGAVGANLVLPHEIGSLKPMGVTEDIITADLRPQRLRITLPETPGLGVALDWARIGKYAPR